MAFEQPGLVVNLDSANRASNNSAQVVTSMEPVSPVYQRNIVLVANV